MNGGGGDDMFYLGATFNAGDHLNGADGDFNSIFLDGDYSKGLTLNSHMVANIADIQLMNGHDYEFAFDNASLASDQQLQIYASNLNANHSLNVDASALSKGSIYIVGGKGADTLIGGSGDDVLQGSRGADHLKGAAGSDTYFYGDAHESTGPHFDTIDGFNFQSGADNFHVTVNISGVNGEVDGGTLTTANFDSDLEGIVGTGQLSANQAVILKPDGDYHGDTFLIVDFNGTAGYQAGEDVVIRLTHATHLSQMAADDFVFDN